MANGQDVPVLAEVEEPAPTRVLRRSVPGAPINVDPDRFDSFEYAEDDVMLTLRGRVACRLPLASV